MLCFHIPEKNSESTYFWGNMPHFHIFSTKMMFLNIWSTDEHPKYQGDFSMTAFSRILAVYLLTLLIMISYPRPWLCAAEYVFECGSCSRIWFLIRGNSAITSTSAAAGCHLWLRVDPPLSFSSTRVLAWIESGTWPQCINKYLCQRDFDLKTVQTKKDTILYTILPDVCSLQIKPVSK